MHSNTILPAWVRVAGLGPSGRTPPMFRLILTLLILGAVAGCGRSPESRISPPGNPPTATGGQVGAAITAASKLSLGMREEEAEKILTASGFTGSMKLGCSHGWNSVFILSNGCSLALDIAPKQARADGAWVGGLLRAADIQSNGVKIVSIPLTDAP